VFPPVTWTDKSEEHIARHNVQPHEVEDVLFSRPRYKTSGIDDTTLVFGQSREGRYLLVVVTDAYDGGTYIVTAREMTDSERRLFKKKGC
jgi:uncharacterized DUF497 family protein